MNTFELARRLGGGAMLKSPGGQRYRISDWSVGTRHVFGHPVFRDGSLGQYQELPSNLQSEEA